MSKKIILVLLSLSVATPAMAGGRDRYNNGYGAYSGYGNVQNSYRGHSKYRDYNHRGRGSGAAVALIGGVILGAALASSSRAQARDVVYVEQYQAPRCYDRQVTEQTVSGRYVTYTENVCR